MLLHNIINFLISQALRHLLLSRKLPEARLTELFTLDTELLVKQFQDLARTSVPVDRKTAAPPLQPLVIVQDPQYGRLKSTVDLELALQTYNVYRCVQVPIESLFF